MGAQRICSVDECGKPVRCRGRCGYHYTAARKAGLPTRPHAKKGDGQAFVDAAHRDGGAECILWPFTEREGYGTMRIDGRHLQPHRYACILQNGSPPTPKLVARHTCNVKRCVNPRHMLWGTDQDNMDDKIKTGSCTRGEEINFAKLTAEKVLTIRASVETHVALAKRYGVSVNSIMNVRSRFTWKHV
jgi:hypothetical protein